MRQKNKKAQAGAGGLSMLLAAGIMIVLLAIVFGLGGKIIADVGSGAAAGSALANSTQYGGEAINDMSAYLPLIGLIVVIIVILGLLVGYLYSKFVRT